MQNKHKKQKQTFKIKKIISILFIAMIVVITIIAIKNKNKNNNNNTNVLSNEIVVNKDPNLLNGTFVYNENVKYTFNNDNTGILYDKGNEYKYTYTIQEQQVFIDYEDKTIHDATYTFYFVNDNLKLIGGEGTSGGEYILKKEI